MISGVLGGRGVLRAKTGGGILGILGEEQILYVLDIQICISCVKSFHP